MFVAKKGLEDKEKIEFLAETESESEDEFRHPFMVKVDFFSLEFWQSRICVASRYVHCATLEQSKIHKNSLTLSYR